MVDLNADGKPDLVGLSGNVLTIRLNRGSGLFSVSQTMVLAWTPGYFKTVSVADVNGDGKPDIVITSRGGNSPSGLNITTLLGNGDGTFAAPITKHGQTFAGR